MPPAILRIRGTPAPKPQVAAAISTAAASPFKPWLTSPDESPRPAITVRLALVQAIAWEESGWQSTIIACDGGVGTMQLMPATTKWLNELQYGTNYVAATLDGNVMLGTGYLAYLVRFFGDKYFGGNYSLAGDPNKTVLLDLVICAYQAGQGTIDDAYKSGRDMPNAWYRDTVEGFMVSQPWTSAT